MNIALANPINQIQGKRASRSVNLLIMMNQEQQKRQIRHHRQLAVIAFFIIMVVATVIMWFIVGPVASKTSDNAWAINTRTIK